MEIIDEKNWLSKRQRQKIRQFLEENEFDKSRVLELIEYRMDEGKYTNCEVIDGKLVFSIVDRNLLKSKLRDRINNMKGKRTVVQSDAWRKYYELINVPALKGAMIPKPTDIVKNKEQFEIFKNADKSGWFKNYIDCCIAEEDQLLSASK